MSFRINTNVVAMNSLRNLTATNLSAAKSMTRLSTGLRINSAGDDPAGLIVSEGLRAQITGLDQAIRNNQDAINYAKTAEGALGEVHRLLNDARSLAVASGNDATLDDTQRQANQSQINSIINSVTRIAQTTAYGNKKLLDGSAGTTAASTSGANVSGMSFSGVFDGKAVTGSSTVTVTVTTDAERATITGSKTFAAATTTMTAGSFTLNGVSFATSSTDTIQDVVARINESSTQTGVSASWAAGAGVTLTSAEFGADAKVQLVDSNGVLLTSAGQSSDTGVDAVADVAVDIDGTGSGTATTVTFNKGAGLVVRDLYGNSLTLTEAGNATTAATAMGQIHVGSSNFQIGGNANETTALSLTNMASTELGKDVVSGKSFNDISVLTANGATDAIKIIDKAISDVSSSRSNIGNFQRNVLESNVRSLGVSRENLAASESSIRDVDVADEMTSFTKLQILQQSGLSMLAQANSFNQSVLSLLR